MTRSSQRAAENVIERLESILRSGVNEEGNPLTDEERNAIDMQIANVYYDLEEL